MSRTGPIGHSATSYIVVVSTLILVPGFLIWIGWGRFNGLLHDQGWPLQVAQRVVQGELLYGDIKWPYGPLPILIFSTTAVHANVTVLSYSILQAVIFALSILTLYALHRYLLSPVPAMLCVFLGMIGFGGFWAFLDAYSITITLGAFGTLLTLWALVDRLLRSEQGYSTPLLAIALTISLLAKLEYAIASLGLVLLSVIIVWLVPVRKEGHPLFARSLLPGLVGGLVLSGGVYLFLASKVGWEPILYGFSGYNLWTDRGLAFTFKMRGSLTAVRQLAGFGVFFALALAAFSYRQWSHSRRSLSFVFLSVSFLVAVASLAAVAAWSSNWLQSVQAGDVLIWDLTLLKQWLRTPPTYRIFWYEFFRDPLVHAIGVCLLLVLLALLPRWMRRVIYRQPVISQQAAFLIILIGTILIDARGYVTARGDLRMTGVFMLGLLLSSEFPQFDCTGLLHRRAKLLRALILALCVSSLVFGGAVFLARNFPIVGPHGQALIEPATGLQFRELIDYVEHNSEPEDYIIAFANYPGLYYMAGRRNALPQDYVMYGLATTEVDGLDCLERLEHLRPQILLALQIDSDFLGNNGLLHAQQDTNTSIQGAPQRAGIYGDAAPLIAAYVQEHYELDRLFHMGTAPSLAAFKRVK